MKKLLVYFIALITCAAIITSCASPRYGCPTNLHSNKPFRS